MPSMGERHRVDRQLILPLTVRRVTFATGAPFAMFVWKLRDACVMFVVLVPVRTVGTGSPASRTSGKPTAADRRGASD